MGERAVIRRRDDARRLVGTDRRSHREESHGNGKGDSIHAGVPEWETIGHSNGQQARHRPADVTHQRPIRGCGLDHGREYKRGALRSIAARPEAPFEGIELAGSISIDAHSSGGSRYRLWSRGLRSSDRIHERTGPRS